MVGRCPVGADIQAWVVLTVVFRRIVIGIDRWLGHEGLHQEVKFEAWQRFSSIVTPRDVGAWVGDELEAQPKEGAEIGRWILCSGKAVKCQVGGPVEVVPNCHFGKVDRGVVTGRLG